MVIETVAMRPEYGRLVVTFFDWLLSARSRAVNGVVRETKIRS